LVVAVEESEKKLSKNPFSGRKTDFENIYKIQILHNFSLYYRINSDIVEILAFWDNRRNPDDLKIG
jgi:hypothetical protein